MERLLSLVPSARKRAGKGLGEVQRRTCCCLADVLADVGQNQSPGEGDSKSEGLEGRHWEGRGESEPLSPALLGQRRERRHRGGSLVAQDV